MTKNLNKIVIALILIILFQNSALAYCCYPYNYYYNHPYYYCNNNNVATGFAGLITGLVVGAAISSRKTTYVEPTSVTYYYKPQEVVYVERPVHYVKQQDKIRINIQDIDDIMNSICSNELIRIKDYLKKFGNRDSAFKDLTRWWKYDRQCQTIYDPLAYKLIINSDQSDYKLTYQLLLEEPYAIVTVLHKPTNRAVEKRIFCY